MNDPEDANPESPMRTLNTPFTYRVRRQTHELSSNHYTKGTTRCR